MARLLLPPPLNGLAISGGFFFAASLRPQSIGTNSGTWTFFIHFFFVFLKMAKTQLGKASIRNKKIEGMSASRGGGSEGVNPLSVSPIDFIFL